MTFFKNPNAWIDQEVQATGCTREEAQARLYDKLNSGEASISQHWDIVEAKQENYGIPPEVISGITKLRNLLAEAYEHYFARNSFSHHKSSEGAVTIHLQPFFWDAGHYTGNEDDSEEIGVSVYSYVFGDHGREYYFKNIQDALITVGQWHAHEMRLNHDSETQAEFCNGCGQKMSGTDTYEFAGETYESSVHTPEEVVSCDEICKDDAKCECSDCHYEKNKDSIIEQLNSFPWHGEEIEVKED